jgi:hypothetical protein
VSAMRHFETRCRILKREGINVSDQPNQRPNEEPLTAHAHIDVAAGVNLSFVKSEMSKVNTFNAKVAVLVTNLVGSMWCAYLFTLLALCSLPAVLSGFHVFATAFPNWLVKTSVIALVAWVAQTFLQLVLLSVIMVGQAVQSAAADARAANTYNDSEWIKNQVDEHTDGGLKVIVDSLNALPEQILSQVKTLLDQHDAVLLAKLAPAK